jgi:hypothetical protein
VSVHGVHVQAVDSNLHPLELGVRGALTKWLFSGINRSEPRQASTVYIAPSSTSLVLHLGTEKYHMPWRGAIESAGQVSLPVICQAVCVAKPQPNSCTVLRPRIICLKYVHPGKRARAQKLYIFSSYTYAFDETFTCVWIILWCIS